MSKRCYVRLCILESNFLLTHYLASRGFSPMLLVRVFENHLPSLMLRVMSYSVWFADPAPSDSLLGEDLWVMACTSEWWLTRWYCAHVMLPNNCSLLRISGKWIFLCQRIFLSGKWMSCPGQPLDSRAGQLFCHLTAHLLRRLDLGDCNRYPH